MRAKATRLRANATPAWATWPKRYVATPLHGRQNRRRPHTAKNTERQLRPCVPDAGDREVARDATAHHHKHVGGLRCRSLGLRDTCTKESLPQSIHWVWTTTRLGHQRLKSPKNGPRTNNPESARHKSSTSSINVEVAAPCLLRVCTGFLFVPDFTGHQNREGRAVDCRIAADNLLILSALMPKYERPDGCPAEALCQPALAC